MKAKDVLSQIGGEWQIHEHENHLEAVSDACTVRFLKEKQDEDGYFLLPEKVRLAAVHLFGVFDGAGISPVVYLHRANEQLTVAYSYNRFMLAMQRLALSIPVPALALPGLWMKVYRIVVMEWLGGKIDSTNVWLKVSDTVQAKHQWHGRYQEVQYEWRLDEFDALLWLRVMAEHDDDRLLGVYEVPKDKWSELWSRLWEVFMANPGKEAIVAYRGHRLYLYMEGQAKLIADWNKYAAYRAYEATLLFPFGAFLDMVACTILSDSDRVSVLVYNGLPLHVMAGDMSVRLKYLTPQAPE